MTKGTQEGKRTWRSTWLLGLLLLPLLGLLVSLQVQWLGELATAQHEVTHRTLETAATRIANEFQETLSQVQESVLAGSPLADTTVATLVAEVVPLEPGEEAPSDLLAFIAEEGSNRLLVILDADRLQAELFPLLARNALGVDGLETYSVSVVSTGDEASVLYRSHPHRSGSVELPDASAELHLRPNRWRIFLGDQQGDWDSKEGPVWVANGEPDGTIELVPAPWQVEVRHLAGSLDVALADARRRNLLLGGGLLAVILAGVALLWIAEKRSRHLAEKELAFVAGVSHELRTPIAVVRTASSNLSRGLVTEHDRVMEYGELIERETTRLASLVERVLRFCIDIETFWIESH